jgi:hypothetical protein
MMTFGLASASMRRKPQVGPDGGLPDRGSALTDPDNHIRPLRSKVVIVGYNAQTSVVGGTQIFVTPRPAAEFGGRPRPASSTRRCPGY